MRSIKITNGIILKQKHIMQEQKKPVGRPAADEPKTEHIRIRVTKSEKAMLKHSGVNMSDIINKGLHILMPTLGIYIEDENRWIEHKEKGTDANLVAYNAICQAIDILKTRREFINKQHKESGAFQSDKPPCFPNGYFSSSEAELLNVLCSQKATLETHTTFYDLSAKDHK